MSTARNSLVADDVKRMDDGANDRSPPLLEAAETAAENLLDAVLARQRQYWMHGKRIPVAERLRANPALAANGAFAAELIYDEFVLREKAGESPRWDVYFEEFPQYAEQLSALRLAEMIVGDTLGPPTENGTQFGDYELLEQIGQGGMGVVYKALQRSLGRTVAVKMLRSSGFAPQGELDRLLKEMSAASGLNHPNIVHVYTVGERADQPFIVFEFVDGPSLAQRIGGTPLSARTSATIVAAVCLAVQYANERGIIHRDLKPANVMLSGPADQPVPKVTDFGASKQIGESASQQLSQIIGTPSYMAPEQLDGHVGELGETTDVYGLGTILYECLTGMPPFRGDSAAEILRQVAEEPPVAPRLINSAVPRDLETICLKCLSKNPRDRYAAAKEVADELNRFLVSKPIKARPPGTIRLVRHWCRRNPVAAVLSGLLLVAVSAGIAGIVVQWRRAEVALQAAEIARTEAVASEEASHELVRDLIEASESVAVLGDRSGHPQIEPLIRAGKRGEALLDRSPHNVNLRMALTDVYGQLGARNFYRGQITEMNAWFEKAQSLWQFPANETPVDSKQRYYLAKVTAYRAWTAAARIDHPLALQLSLRATDIWQELSDEQKANLEILERLTEARRQLMDLSSSTHGRDESFEGLKNRKAELSSLVLKNNTVIVLRKRLALTCALLGANRDFDKGTPVAASYWREAYEQYRIIVASEPDDILSRQSLAQCCARLAKRQPSDSYYVEAVRLLVDISDRLTDLLSHNPDAEWLRRLNIESLCLLMSCHSKIGNTDEANRIYRSRLLPLAKRMTEQGMGSAGDLSLARVCLNLAAQLREGSQTDAALSFAREAAIVASKVSTNLKGDLGYARERGDLILMIATILSQLGDNTLALQQAEKAHRIWEECCQNAPPDAVERTEHDLAGVWERIGKIHWKCGRFDEALQAFRASAAVEKRAFGRASLNCGNRVMVDHRYVRLAYWSGLRCDWRGVAGALQEREKLWPDNSRELFNVANDYRLLAQQVTQGRAKATPREQIEGKGYLSESERIRQDAEALIRGTKASDKSTVKTDEPKT